MKRDTTRKGLLVSTLTILTLILLLGLSACGEEKPPASSESTITTATTGTTAQTGTSVSAAETTTPSSEAGPTAGGTLRWIHNSTPQVLSFWPAMGPSDEFLVTPAMERLVKWTTDGVLAPDLAESVEEDPDALTMTFKLRKGVKFHDGSELTAEVVKWNFDMGMPAGKVQYADAIKSFEIVDPYTFVLHLNYWNNQLLSSFGMQPMFSKEAFEKNGGEQWARTNIVATGPFMLKEFKRDQSVTWVKNPNWWGGEPYLDGVELTVVVDPTISSDVMMAGDADVWTYAEQQYAAEATKKGLVVQMGPTSQVWGLWPNVVDPQSPAGNQKVREAVEYAIDRPALAQAIGYGIAQPVEGVTHQSAWGAGAEVVKRNYDPEKAKQLLAEAGYANGCPITLLALVGGGGRNTVAEAVKGYLDAAGFVTTLDLADPGRFYGSVFGTGWKDFVLYSHGDGFDFLYNLCAWFGPQPKTRLASLKSGEEFAKLFEPALSARTEEEKRSKTIGIAKYMNEKALIVPLYHVPLYLIQQPYVHTDYPLAGPTYWSWGVTWMEAH